MTWSDLTALVATLPLKPGDAITRAEFTKSPTGFTWFVALKSEAGDVWELSGHQVTS